MEISPDVLGILRRASIVDCNDLKQVRLLEFNARFVRKEIRYFETDVPATLRHALRKAIHASPIVPDEFKALIAPP